MSPHVSVLYNMIDDVGGWERIFYDTTKQTLPSAHMNKKTLDAGDKALVSCEVYNLLKNLKLFPAQSSIKDTDVKQICELIDRKRVKKIAKVWKTADELPVSSNLGVCRGEDKEVNAAWPLASIYTHSSVTCLNFAQAIRKITL